MLEYLHFSHADPNNAAPSASTISKEGAAEVPTTSIPSDALFPSERLLVSRITKLQPVTVTFVTSHDGCLDTVAAFLRLALPQSASATRWTCTVGGELAEHLPTAEHVVLHGGFGEHDAAVVTRWVAHRPSALHVWIVGNGLFCLDAVQLSAFHVKLSETATMVFRLHHAERCGADAETAATVSALRAPVSLISHTLTVPDQNLPRLWERSHRIHFIDTDDYVSTIGEQDAIAILTFFVAARGKDLTATGTQRRRQNTSARYNQREDYNDKDVTVVPLKNAYAYVRKALYGKQPDRTSMPLQVTIDRLVTSGWLHQAKGHRRRYRSCISVDLVEACAALLGADVANFI
eukprot:PhM_4_TR10202/c1_g1_i1/m.40865